MKLMNKLKKMLAILAVSIPFIIIFLFMAYQIYTTPQVFVLYGIIFIIGGSVIWGARELIKAAQAVQKIKGE